MKILALIAYLFSMNAWSEITYNQRFADVESGMSVQYFDSYLKELTLARRNEVQKSQNFFKHPITKFGVGSHAVCGSDDHEVLCFREITGQGVKALGLSKVDSIAVGEIFACAITGQEVKCWNVYVGYSEKVPFQFKNPKKIVVGDNHRCVLDDDGVKCWSNRSYDNVFLVENNFKSPKDIVSGKNHACVLDDEGVKCWSYGKKMDVPDELGKIRDIKASGDRTCVLDDKIIKCWGKLLRSKNEYFEYKPSPTRDVQSIEIGSENICMLEKRINSTGALKTGYSCFRLNQYYTAYKNVSLMDGYAKKGELNPLMLNHWNSCFLNNKGIHCVFLDSFPEKSYSYLIPGSVNESVSKILINDKRTCMLNNGRVFCYLNSYPYCEKLNDMGLSDVKFFTQADGISCAVDAGGLKCWNEYGIIDTYSSIFTNLSSPTGLTILPNDTIYLQELGRISAASFGAKTTFLTSVDWDQSRFFYKEKSIPLQYAQQKIENSWNEEESVFSAYVYIKHMAQKAFTIGMQNESVNDIFNNSAYIQNTFNSRSMKLWLRTDKSFRFMFSLISKTLESSKYLLSPEGKISVEALQLSISTTLTQETITDSMAKELIDKILAENLFVKEMEKSHRLVGIKAFYDQIRDYLFAGKLEN